MTIRCALLLEAARAIASETVEAEIKRVAVESLARLCGAPRAGWVDVGAAGRALAQIVPDGDEVDPAEVLTCADIAVATRSPASVGRTACIPVVDDEGVHGIVFTHGPVTSDVADAAPLAGFVLSSLRNAGLFASLDTLVAQEMTRVVEREASMQLVLDSMAEGLLVCDVRGQLGPIRSKAIVTWFGEPAPEATLGAYLGSDAGQAMLFDMGFETLVEDIMPFEVVTEQLPGLVTRGDRSYRLKYQAVMENEAVEQVVVTVRDITTELAQERADRINRELPVIVGMLLRDRDGFQAFVEELGELFRRLAESESLPERKRIVHTLKGNAATFGFSIFADACHALETRVADDPAAMSLDAISALEQDWARSLERISMLLTDEDGAAVRLSPRDYESLLQVLERRIDHHDLMRMVRAWRHPAVATVLGPYVATAKKTAARLDKEVDVVLDDKGLRLPHADLRSFCATLVHVLRNALDHGIEAPEERLRAGKAAAGRITIAARTEASAFVLAISDDGRGIDWARLRAKAEAAGLAAETERDLVDALFADGVSTRDDVTALSGRGVGLGATKTRCEDLGGALSVKTVPGSGTTFEFAFPIRSSLAPAA